ncbi:phage major tail protein, TP901-1 family [Marininema mesophilum]|uniref:Phage major tail protein, TP901-1 family n=1 Tax=Marininema mesophilum TaxID=1048340 RepID=A0A1H3BTB9_9BACL|nr:phage tail tube protein [Marininema mesophilum]SDX45036.1 phage major tail protein, TP901-1 family [Marininema mesophilum]
MAKGDVFSGNDVTLWVNDPATPAGSPVFVGGQSETKFKTSTETIEVTRKKPIGGPVWKEFLPGAQEWELDNDAFWVQDDEGITLLNTAKRTGTPVIIQWRQPDGKMKEGTAIITELSEESPMDDGYSMSMSLQGTGAYDIKDIPKK